MEHNIQEAIYQLAIAAQEVRDGVPEAKKEEVHCALSEMRLLLDQILGELEK